jgi:L-asparagine permease
VFEIVLNLAGLGIVGVWGSIIICHWLFVRKMKKDGLERPGFRLPWAPVTNVITLLFLVLVVLLMALDPGVGRITLGAFAVVVILMVIGWYRVRGRIDPAALTSTIDITEDVPPLVVRDETE